MQIAAASPEYVRREEVPEHVLERERHIARQQAINDGKDVYKRQLLSLPSSSNGV